MLARGSEENCGHGNHHKGVVITESSLKEKRFITFMEFIRHSGITGGGWGSRCVVLEGWADVDILRKDGTDGTLEDGTYRFPR